MQTSEISERKKVFFLPVNTGYVEGKLPDRRCLEFYRARSGSGLHCAIVGNVVVPGGSPSNSATAELSDSAVWRDLASAIRSAGAKPGIQLATAWPHYKGMTGFLHKKGEDPVEDYRRVVAGMNSAQIEAVFESLFRGTTLAINSGFEHVQLHAAHGYLFNLLLDDRFHAGAERAWDAVRRWVKMISDKRLESSVRISMSSGDAMLDQKSNSIYLQGAIAAAPTYIDVSNGFYNVNKNLIYPNVRQIDERSVRTKEIATANPKQMFIASGLSSPLQWGSYISNVHTGICRDLIANPQFLVEQSGGCSMCMKCHYHSLKRSEVSCGKWSS